MKAKFDALSGKYAVEGHEHDPMAHHDTKKEAREYAKQQRARVLKEHEQPYWDKK